MSISTNRLGRFTLGRPTQLPDSSLDGSHWTIEITCKGKAKKEINFWKMQVSSFFLYNVIVLEVTVSSFEQEGRMLMSSGGVA